MDLKTSRSLRSMCLVCSVLGRCAGGRCPGGRCAGGRCGAPGSVKGRGGAPRHRGCKEGARRAQLGRRSMSVASLSAPRGGPAWSLSLKPQLHPPPPPLRSPRPGPLLGTASSPPGVRLTRRRPAQCRALCTSVGSGRLLEGRVRGQRGSGPSIPPGSQIGGSAVTEHATQFCARGARACASPASLLGGWGGGAPQTQGPVDCGTRMVASVSVEGAQRPPGAAPLPAPSSAHLPVPAPRAPRADVRPRGLVWRPPPHTSVWGAAERAGPSCLRDGLALCPRTATGQCCWWRPPGGHSALSRLAVLGPAGLPDASRAGLVPPDHVPHGAASVAFWRLLLICVTP